MSCCHFQSANFHVLFEWLGWKLFWLEITFSFYWLGYFALITNRYRLKWPSRNFSEETVFWLYMANFKQKLKTSIFKISSPNQQTTAPFKWFSLFMHKSRYYILQSSVPCVVVTFSFLLISIWIETNALILFENWKYILLLFTSW